jgi:hypothetical protein
MAQAQFFAVGFPYQDILYMLVVCGSEVGLSFFQSVEFVTFQRFDER